MIVVNLMGGVGNQMFQYAFGRNLAKRYNMPLLLNKSIYNINLLNRNFDLDIFRLNDDILYETAMQEDVIGNRRFIYLKETQFSFNEEITSFLDSEEDISDLGVITSGYWQSFKYFSGIEDIIRAEFSFLNPLTGKWRELHDHILSTDSVMINVRRGDYLYSLDFHGVVSSEYINASMQLCRNKIKHPVFFVFSDDMDWCRKTIAAEENIVFVDETYYDAKYQYYLQLMTACKHFIISNSSFAWWSAWLSENKNKIVIAPERWFAKNEIDTKDLTPEDWIRI